ncbi:tripartite tricarboxylate transporter substrate binding protein [Bordetella sp. N]|uniref:Bug family tripartite tricarboxylate transporter substrate binding protein n=1 Tax=Bordetella sp. N TaxID=1746199 RepID=UPI00070EF6CD|nr:tripartite tricarboxylate transporter substrate binding protein [Bordetella sp. N]ALM84282.1 LacI family transcriptional regulator [Bordetella sp. N]
MKNAWRHVLSTALTALALSVVAAPAQSAYPDKPVRLIVPYPPGGPTDILGRMAAQYMTEKTGQTFIVENRAGASGMIGAETVARASADGYTLLVNASIHVIYPSLYKQVPIDPIKDFTPISQIALVPLVLVMSPKQPVQSVAMLVEAAKASPGRFRFASSGNGAAPHLAGEAFDLLADVKMQHIPYKGSAPALTDLIGGHVDLMFDSLPSSMPHIKNGSLKALAVTTGKRIPSLPDVPTVAEGGVKGYEITTWYGIWGPKGLPADLASQVSKMMAEMVKDPKYRERLDTLGAEPVGSTPDAFAKFQVDEERKFGDIVRQSGAKLD